MAPRTELPRYACVKIVQACRIASVEMSPEGGCIIQPAEEGVAPYVAGPDYVRRCGLQDGGYFVLYADGYESWSPVKPFEEGYRRIPDDPQ